MAKRPFSGNYKYRKPKKAKKRPDPRVRTRGVFKSSAKKRRKGSSIWTNRRK